MATTPQQPVPSPLNPTGAINATQRAMTSVQAAQKERLTNAVDSLAAVLDGIEIPKLPESHFKSFFLPYFTGKASPDDGRNALAQWISVASTPASEVSIIDDVTGAELFRVPPLLDPTIINPVRAMRKGNMGFAEIVKLSMSYGAQIPVRGERVLNDSLARKQHEIRTTSAVHSEYEKRWLSIFKRYGAVRADLTPEAARDEGSLADDEMEF
jgi:hypothetical protein